MNLEDIDLDVRFCLLNENFIAGYKKYYQGHLKNKRLYPTWRSYSVLSKSWVTYVIFSVLYLILYSNHQFQLKF